MQNIARGLRTALLCGALGAAPAMAQVAPTTQVPPDVEAFTTAWVEAIRTRDVPRWSELFAEDGIMFPGNGSVVRGRAAFQAFWNRVFDGQTGPNPYRVETLGFKQEGKLATVSLAYGPDGGTTVGHTIWVLEARAGKWQMVWWAFTRVPPARQPPG